MNLLDYAKRVAVRRVVYIIIAAIIAIATQFIGDASAQTPQRVCSTSNRCTLPQALEYCNADIAFVRSKGTDTSGVVCKVVDDITVGMLNSANMCPNFNDLPRCSYFYIGSCPSGQIYNASTNQCQTLCDAGSWPDPNNPGQCLDNSDCLSRNGTDYTNGNRTGPSKSWCEGGCRVNFKKGESYGVGVGGKFLWTGAVEYTGGSCEAQSSPSNEPLPEVKDDDKPKKPKDDECTPIEGQTVCVKPDGDLCAKSSSKKKEFCWKPHQTGEKSDADEMQNRKPKPGPDQIALPNGDTATKTDSTNVQAETNGGQKSNTAIDNYRTNSGADAPRSKDGGANGDKSGDDDGDKDGEQSSGGESCESPPVVTGDPGEQQIAMQAWRARCDSENTRKAERDFASNLSSQNDGNEPSGNGWLNGNGQSGAIGSGSLDGSWVSFGGSCPPAPSVAFGDKVFSWPAGFCEALAAIRWLLIAAAYIWGIRIVVGR